MQCLDEMRAAAGPRFTNGLDDGWIAKFLVQDPWIVTLHGAVVHDSGGYGMLTLGHGPQKVLEALSKDVVQANIMTASVDQAGFVDALEKELGRNRKNGNPYESYV